MLQPRAGFLDRERIIAPPGYNRWLVPPAALSIHLAIGEVYAFSVFNLPLKQAGGWALTEIGWVFSIAIVFLGLSAAVFGKWLERVGPRKAMFASAACFGGGFLVSAVAVEFRQLWLLYLGYGVLGGIGLGLGYISPVATLIKWFPDRPGMATGLAIMGFGGGAMIGSPLSQTLMDRFGSPESTGVTESFAVLGVIYFGFMSFGVATVRLPPPGWNPGGTRKTMRPGLRGSDTNADAAIRTLPFWLLWGVLFLNVTAGIGVLGQASPMIQEMFPGRVSPAAAAGFVGLLSLFNMLGRFVWSSLSDAIGRKTTYAIFFSLGAVLYALTPETGRLGSLVLFVAAYAVIMSMYGGGFATIPAYLRDQFGTTHVGAIHGRLLTAWSLAGIAGPVLVNYIRQFQIDQGVPRVEAYTVTMYLMAGLLVIGLVCNALVKRPAANGSPVDGAGQRGPDALPVESLPTEGRAVEAVADSTAEPTLVLRWLWVLIPLAWGVYQTLQTSVALFR